MINVLQILLNLPLFSLSFPANVQIIFSLIIGITNFSFFQTTIVENVFFTFTPTDPYNLNFDAMDIFWNPSNNKSNNLN